MKKIIGIVLALVIAVGVGFFVLDNPLGRLVKLAVNEFGPQIMQADVHVSGVNISTGDGQGRLSNLRIGNPAGFKTDHLFKVGVIEIALDPTTVADNVVVIHKILIDAPDIIFEKGKKGSNFDALQRNIDSYAGGGSKQDKSSPGKKMIIDSFVIRNAKVNYNGLVDLSLPDIELRNVGKKKGGATSGEVVKAAIAELNYRIGIAVAKTAVITSVGGVAVGAGMAIKGLLGK